MTATLSSMPTQRPSADWWPQPPADSSQELDRYRRLMSLYRALGHVAGMQATLVAFSRWLMPLLPHTMLGVLNSSEPLQRHILQVEPGRVDAEQPGLRRTHLDPAVASLFHGLALTGREELRLDSGLTALLWPLPAAVDVDRFMLVCAEPPDAAQRSIVEEGLAELAGPLRLAVHYEHLFRESRSDALTGLANRRVLEDALEQAHDRALRYGRPAVLLNMDLDNFKRVNDRHGHDVGDRVLAAVAGAMRASVRGSDVLARVGGDEFTLLLPESDARCARNLSRRLECTVRATVRQTPESHDVGVSIGRASWRPGMTPASWWKAADRALYRVKARRHGMLSAPRR